MAESIRRVRRTRRAAAESWPCALRSALLLAPLALGVAYLGGCGICGVLGNCRAHRNLGMDRAGRATDRRAVLFVGSCSNRAGARARRRQLTLAKSCGRCRLSAALIIIVMGMFAVAIIAPAGRGAWLAAGISYAGALGLRQSCCAPTTSTAFVAIILLFAVVWATDIAAYFVGPRHRRPEARATLQPEQDLVGCARRAGGAATVAAMLQVAGLGSAELCLHLVAIVLSVASQAGDLFESALEAAVRRQGFRSPYSGSRRLDGPARRFRHRCRAGLRYWPCTRRDRSARARAVGVVTDDGQDGDKSGNALRRTSAASRSWARPVRSATAPSI